MLLLLALLQDPPPPPEIDERTERAIERGLDFLAKQQGSGGALRSSYAVAATSLAGLAWLAHGDTPDRGRYAPQVRAALESILKSTARNGYISDSSAMHGHGYAVLFLAQAAGTVEDPALRERLPAALTDAVRLIERTQNSYGGWNSTPNPGAGDDGSGAIAVMQIMGLRAAREVGITIDEPCITRAKKYLREMTNAQGWYQYNYHMRQGSTQSSALTGAGMYMLGAFDLYDDPKYALGIKNLMNAAPHLKGGAGGGDQGWSGWYHYTAFYASIAIFQHGGEEWRRWWPGLRENLLRQQAANGSWPDSYGGVYTALCLLTLELPYRTLPVFQTGGRGREGS